jgi:DNA-binding CsgD family transcriptional regulator
MASPLERRILALLAENPHWGPQTVARAAGTTARTVRVTASNKKIKFMDRYQVEEWIDAKLGVERPPTDG